MNRSILCVDIGGTRIKAALLDEPLDATSLSRQRVVVRRSLGWLNAHLPRLFSREDPASLLADPRLSGDVSRVAVAVPGPVVGGRFRRDDLDVPRDLRRVLSEQAGVPVTLARDADAWMGGFDVLCRRIGRPLAHPAIAVVLGTGVGLSATDEEGRVRSLEIAAWTTPFEKLGRAAGRAVPRERPWEVHHMVGRPFFDWVGSEHWDWGHERIARELTDRVVALLEDVLPGVDPGRSAPHTIVLGGGNVEYVDLARIREAFQAEVVCSADLCSPADIDPDLVPLLGLRELAAAPEI